MENLRTGTEYIKNSQPGGSRRLSSYTPFISWRDGDTKSIYFVTPIDEVPKVLMHQFVKKVVAGEKDRWMTFMCRKDPAWRQESNNECFLCDVLGHKPTERFAAIAVEVEPDTDAKGRVKDVQLKYNLGKNKEGEDVQYPAVGLILHGPRFFGTLVAHSQKRDISELSWEISREGSDKTTTYSFYPIEHMPNLDGVDIPDLHDILSYYGSLEKYENDLDENVVIPNFDEDVIPVADRFTELENKLENVKVESYV